MVHCKPESIVQVNLADVYAAGAANRLPDQCDADPAAARALNVQATGALAEATSSRDILLIYISTDYVFPGTKGEAPYEAHAPTAPPNVYGQTKLDGEEAVLRATATTHLGVVLRVPVLYGKANKRSESAVNTLLDTVTKSGLPGAEPAVVDDVGGYFAWSTTEQTGLEVSPAQEWRCTVLRYFSLSLIPPCLLYPIPLLKHFTNRESPSVGHSLPYKHRGRGASLQGRRREIPCRWRERPSELTAHPAVLVRR